jgi:hypothetical protein
MQETLESWLVRAEDPDQAWVALYQDVYPFGTHAEMATRLRDVAARFPELADRCEDLIATRRPAIDDQPRACSRKPA